MQTMGMESMHGGGDAGDEVGGAGAGGGHADADLAGGARVAVGHVRGALLVAHEDVADGELAQRVVDGQDGAAGIAEDGGDALADECGPDDLGAGEGGVRFLTVCSLAGHRCVPQGAEARVFGAWCDIKAVPLKILELRCVGLSALEFGGWVPRPSP